jgi:outer membrane biosynthesis protein TonB
MAKRQYESKIAVQTRNFLNINNQNLAEPEEKPEVKAVPEEKPVEKKTTPKEDKPKKTAPVKTEEKTIPEEKTQVEEADPVTEKVNDIIKSLIESGQLQPKKSGKIGRPKKYEDDTIVASIRMTKENYDYAYNVGRMKFNSMTEYVNHLIEEDMKK